MFVFSTQVCVSPYIPKRGRDKITIMWCCYIIRDAVFSRVFISKKWFKMFKADFVQIPTQRSRILSFRSDNPVMRLDAHQFKKFWTVQGCIHPDVMATRPDTLKSSTKIRFSFADTYMGKQLHPSGQHG
jgi:hypothetical protein